MRAAQSIAGEFKGGEIESGRIGLAKFVAAFVSNNPLPKGELPALIHAVHSAVERRHLAGLGLTPEQYRQKWNLPSDYPMVAPNYAAQRSALAKKIGLGQNSAESRCSQE